MYFIVERKKLLLLIPFALVIISVALFFSFDTTTSALSWQIADKTFVIDAGHGGIFPGKVSNSGIEEKEINLAIASYLQTLLTESGSITVMTRTSDDDLVPAEQNDAKLIVRQRADLQARTNIAAASQADFYISIHCNSAPSATWSGAQTFFAPDDPESAALAQAIQRSLTSQLKNTNRQAIVRNDTFLFEHLQIPSVIVECGFLSNDTEAALLNESAYQQKVAYAIYYGISDYLTTLEPQSR